ncbi:MAG TPA: ribonuclease domain-containing protein [Rhodanobacteraceae bacterium]|jgi:guanyl-specific ribonuclease Sa|nr:ribonuclease domain-containing protein [Rhodanobacteraceae bacterium]
MRRTWRSLFPLVILALIAGYLYWHRGGAPAPTTSSTPAATASINQSSHRSDAATLPAFLPPEARDTLALIARGGPFPHHQDGVVFGNYEHLLPTEPRGYYHEYTVETPGAHNRGARRIITGGEPPRVYYYTDDHYRSFREFTVP